MKTRLIESEKGSLFFISAFEGSKKIVKRLLSIGVVPKKQFWVQNKYNNGVIVISDGCLKVALDSVLARQIIVNLL